MRKIIFPRRPPLDFARPMSFLQRSVRSSHIILMSSSPNPVCFAEQNDFALLLARGAATGRALRVEALAEIPLTNAAALAEAARTVLAGGAPLVCALRPAGRILHLATAAESAAHAGPAGAQRFAAGLPGLAGADAPWIAAARARDGAAPDHSPWLLAAAAAEPQAQALAALGSLGLKPARTVSAAHHAAGAVAAIATSPTLLVEIGAESAHALLIGPGGVLAAAPISLNLDRIAEAVQTELGMKFRGSAVKLLFNPDYDFTEAAPRIAARLAAVLKPELAALRGTAPATLACSGLPAAQHWLANALAAALDLTPFAPDVKAWCASSGTTFASADLEAALSPAWIGFLRLIGTGTEGGASAWNAPWQIAPAAAAPAPAPAVPAAASAPVAGNKNTPPPAPPAAPVAKSAPAAPVAPAPVKTAPAPSPVISVKTVATPKPAAPVPAPAEKPVAPVPVGRAAVTAPASTTAKAVAATAPVARATVPDSAVSYPAKNAPANKAPAKKLPEPVPAKSMVAAAAAKAATPPPASKAPAPKPAAPGPAPLPAAPRSKRPLLWIALAAALVLLIGGGLWWQAQREEEARLVAEKARAEAVRVAEAERVRQAEEKARIEADTRRKVEQENAAKLAAAEASRQQAEHEARIQAAIRIANARGSLTVGGPAGATVTVGELPPRTAPVTFRDLKLGRYPVTVSLPHHETAKLELDVRENETADAGNLRLARVVGTLILSSEPADANFEVRATNTIILGPDAVRRGRTPASFNDIAPGDYTITFTREGWQPHTETVSVGRDTTVRAACAFRTGIVKLTTTPAGAAVTQGGVSLGVTPLTLLEQNPGEVTYELTLAGHDAEIVEARIQSGQVLAIARSLEPEDRLVRLTDTDERPVAILTPQPEIPTQKLDAPIRVDVVLTVDRHGNPRDLAIAKAPTPEIGKLCLAAAAKWKFKPATVNGKPVNVRVAVPFNILPAQ
jgi:hypothetical protein